MSRLETPGKWHCKMNIVQFILSPSFSRVGSAYLLGLETSVLMETKRGYRHKFIESTENLVGYF